MEGAVLDGDHGGYEDCMAGQKEAGGPSTKFEAQSGVSVTAESEVHGAEFSGRREFDAPCVGMEFETYEDAYNYYNCYAHEAGFLVRVKNSWFKRNSREKYGAVLCCSSQGFKRVKDVNRLRRETRTGCPAMIRIRLVDSKRWRVLEAVLEHNHLLGGKSHKSFKKAGAVSKRKLQMDTVEADARTVKLFRALVMDATNDDGSPSSGDRDPRRNMSDLPNVMNFKKGDAQAIYNFFCRLQLTNPGFFYLMDVTDDGYLRNVFWADARSRAASIHFGDVVYFDDTCLSGKFEIPLATFVGMNHHGQSVLLGCALLAAETMESYNWVFKSWINCMSGHAPRTIISDRCKVLRSSISEAFPNTLHRFGLSHIMRRVPEKIGGLDNYDAIRRALMKAVYESTKVSEFETAWGLMVQRFGVGHHEWLVSLYEDRASWVPVYLKDTFFAGMAAAWPREALNSFFEKYIHKQTPLKEFLDKYELALQRKLREESLADFESMSTNYKLKTRCSFELQLSKVYTKNIFMKFQFEVEEMYSCLSTTQLYVDGPVVVFLVRGRVKGEGNGREIKDYEVLFNRSEEEVRCICSYFNFYGYLCRHALCVLNYNGVEEIPAKYVLPRWRKDYKRLCSPDQGCSDADGGDHAGRFGQLFRSALQIMDSGSISLEHYKGALQALEDCFIRVQRERVKM